MGLFSSIGGMLNDVTGATASANLQNKYQKEFAKNAHQWEMKDLKKAGLNPALTATGGGGASAGGAGGTTGSSGINPVDIISSVVGMNNQTKETNAGVKKTEAETNAIPQQLDNDQINAFANLINAFANQTMSNANANLIGKGKAGQWLGTNIIDEMKESWNKPKKQRVKDDTKLAKKLAKDGNPFAKALLK